MNPARVTLGGVPVLADSPVAWEEVSGPAAPTRVFRVHSSRWGDIRSRLGGEVSLRIAGDSFPTLEVRRLVLVKEVPTAEPFTRSVLVSDLRWWWQYVLVHRDYNVPRKKGTKRLVGADVVELAQSVDDFGFAAWSLDPTTKKRWTARRFVEDVFDQLAKASRASLSLEELPHSDDGYGEATIQNVLLSENGTSAAARALAAVRGLDVTVTRDGTIRVFDASDYPAAVQSLKGRTTTVLGSQARLVDMAGVRPARVAVYFEREVEVRFDSIEEDDEPHTVDSALAESPPPELANVLPLPDPETLVGSDLWACGAWATVKQATEAWNQQFPKLPSMLDVTLENARRYWGCLDAIWTAVGDAKPESAGRAWGARTAAFKNHYRSTYRVPPAFMKHVREVRGHLVGILEPVTGTRGPAQAWGTYCIVPSHKHQIVAAHRYGTAAQFGWQNIDGYPGYDGELYDKPASPCIVRVLDPHLGVLHLDWQTDPYGMLSAIHPSMFEPIGGGSGAASITRDFKNKDAPMAYDAHAKQASPIQLAEAHRVAVLATCIPGAPNSKARLLRIVVEPDEVASRLGPGIDPTGGKGPTYEVYCPPQVMTARYAWRHTAEARETVRALFGFVGDDAAAAAGAAPTPPPAPGQGAPAGPVPPPGGGGDYVPDIGAAFDAAVAELPKDPRSGYEVVNDGSGSPLREVARALAIGVWSGYANAVEGSPAYHLDPSLRPVGNATSVAHGVDAEGRAFSTVGASAARRPLDPMAFLSGPVRTLVVHMVPEGSA